MVLWTLCKILNANLALRACSEKGIVLCVASPRGKGKEVRRPLAERRKGEGRKEKTPKLGGYRHRASF